MQYYLDSTHDRPCIQAFCHSVCWTLFVRPETVSLCLSFSCFRRQRQCREKNSEPLIYLDSLRHIDIIRVVGCRYVAHHVSLTSTDRSHTRQYRRAAHFNTTHVRRQKFYALPQAHQDYLRKPPFSLLDTFSSIDHAIDINADLAEAIMAVGAASIGIEVPDDAEPVWADHATATDLDKCRSTINQLFRDWSAEGHAEREACYAPVLKVLQQLLPSPAVRPKVLVPGSGLGRLVYELCKAGYEVEGNELSYHQLFASSFVLNHTKCPEQYSLYPFISNFSNNLTRSNQLRRVIIPDQCPSTTDVSSTSITGHEGSMAIAAGDFCVSYGLADYIDAFDAVATVFFIDTAPNLIRYVETVRHCLKPGGYWINLGPLLWHFESAKAADAGAGNAAGDEYEHGCDGEDRGIGEPGSFELSEDEVVRLIAKHGFEFVKHETNAISTGYIQDPSSMLQHIYKPVHWMARKKT